MQCANQSKSINSKIFNKLITPTQSNSSLLTIKWEKIYSQVFQQCNQKQVEELHCALKLTKHHLYYSIYWVFPRIINRFHSSLHHTHLIDIDPHNHLHTCNLYNFNSKISHNEKNNHDTRSIWFNIVLGTSINDNCQCTH